MKTLDMNAQYLQNVDTIKNTEYQLWTHGMQIIIILTKLEL